MATFCTVLKNHLGRFLGLYCNYVYIPEQSGIIHSHIHDTATQLEDHARIDNKNSYHILIFFKHGLVYIKKQPPTNEEMDTLDQIIMTSEGI